MRTNETPTKAICNKGFSSNISFLPRSNFDVGGQDISTDAAGNAQTCSFDVTVNATVGISDLSENGISIYPNPTTGIVTIDFTNFANFGKVKIKITDISGKTIENFHIDSFSNFQINISHFQNGIYLLKIETETGVSIDL